MSSIWPWVAVAAAGALHGLNPTTGWMLAAGCGVRSGVRRQSLQALMPIAAGHAASVAVVATALALGHATRDWAPFATGAAVLTLFLMLLRRLRRHRPRPGAHGGSPTATGRFGMALWSFIASTAHGSGMMLVPALVPVCLSESPAREITASGSLPLALAAVAVHALAMLGTLGLVAVAAVCVHARVRGLLGGWTRDATGRSGESSESSERSDASDHSRRRRNCG